MKNIINPPYQNQNQFNFHDSIQQSANILSKILFIWTHTLLKKGAKTPLEMNDLYDIKPQQEPIFAHQQFIKYYQQQNIQNQNKTLYAFKKCINSTFLTFGFLAICSNILQFAGPLMINQILIFLNPSNTQPISKGILWASILVICYLTRTILFQHCMHKINLAAVIIMNSATSKIYDKILKLSSSSRKYLDTGAIMNYINIDIQSFESFLQLSIFLFSSPFMIIIAIILIIRQVGWIGISAPIIFLIGLYFQDGLMKKSFTLRKDKLNWNDKRSKCVNQYFSGIRIVKYYGWEEIVADKIQAIRKQQIKLVFKALILRGYIQVLMNMLPIIASVLIFAVYSKIFNQNQLTPAKVYTTLSLFGLMAFPMRMLVFALVQYASSKAGLERIDHFFQFQEIKYDGIYSQDLSLESGQIKIEEAQFRWQNQQAKNHFEKGIKILGQTKQVKDIQKKVNNPQTKKKKIKSKNKKKAQNVEQRSTSKNKKKLKKKKLKIQSILTQDSLQLPLIQSQQKIKKFNQNNINLKINNLHILQNQFICIVGQVGSGKSTLLYSILNQIDKISGIVKRRGSIAYIPQTSWLRSISIRQNILFQQQFDQQRYKKIINICQLESDLEIIGGDLIEVGQKGVNLSGGQKQRISIARALYADADIYLIDDCLSALDIYVAKKIYMNVIKNFLKQKTVIFVTHAIHLVKQSDRIIVMKNGKIYQLGTYDELTKNKQSLFNTLQVQYQKKEKQYQANQQKKQKSSKIQSSFVIQNDQKKQKLNQEKFFVKVEERLKGSVPWTVYFRFFTGSGYFLTFLMLSSLIISQISRVVSDWWIGSWSVNTFNISNIQYIWIYCLLSIVVGILIYLKTLFFSKFITVSSQVIQKKLIQTLLKTPLYWFDITPTGRILSRTTKDQDDLDNSLAYNFQMSIQNLIIMFSSILIIGLITPYYFIFAIVSLLVYYFLIQFYMLSARELKRLQANTRAPLITHIQQTVDGIYVIRAFKKTSTFINKFFQKQKNYIVSYVNQNYANRWISMVTDFFAIIIIASSAYLGVLSKGSTASNFIGLSLTWALQISTSLSLTLKIMADTQNNMNAAVRLLQYIDNNPAQKDFKNPLPPSQQWPHEGKYKFQNITYRYRTELYNVIHGISFDVESNAKIGVVGRTGSGKSTLILGLLRILQLVQDQNGNKGQINLDDLNVQNLGLHHLRHKIAIIPQDPILFSGTVRSNVDPFNIYSDKQIIQALKKVQIWDLLRPNPQFTEQNQKKINSLIDNSGANFSLGQRQLICMARALIRTPKVLLMDEATASIDQKTDSLIQKMIRKQFKKTTVITIAHRLNTIINYDKILVLDYGRIRQYGKPLNLVLDQKSFLGNLIKQTGKQYQQMIIHLAKQNQQID